MLQADFLIRNAREILTCAGAGPMAGSRQADVSAIPNASLAALDGVIQFVGPAGETDARVTLRPGAVVIDAEDHAVIPGFVDAHTHAVFAGDRRAELRRRLGGATYAAIAVGVAMIQLRIAECGLREKTMRLFVWKSAIRNPQSEIILIDLVRREPAR